MMQTSLKKTLTSGILVFAMVAVAACTKSRNAEVADEGLDAQLISKSELEAEGYQMSLGSDAEALDFKGKPIAVNEKPTFKSRSVSAPQKLSGLLNGLRVQGKSGETFGLKFKITPTLLFVMKRVDDVNSLSAIESGLTEDIRGMKYLPLYTIPVLGIGKLVSQRTDNGERSYKQDFRPTSLAEATHIQLDLRNEAVKAVELSRAEDKRKTRRELFRGEQVNEKVMTVSEFNDNFQSNLNLDPNSKIYTKLMMPEDKSSAGLTVAVYSIQKKSDIKDPEYLKKLASKIASYEIRSCPADVKQSSGLGDDCVIVLTRELGATSKRATLAAGDAGYPTSDVTLENVPAATSTELIQITENTKVSEVGPDQLKSFSDAIAIADIKDKEFIFRRTFEDGSNAITSFGPGGSGSADIVKFVLDDNRLIVRRADPVNANAKATDIDKEELMSLPVRYYNSKDDQGHRLAQPRPATMYTADIVVPDWIGNTLESTASPLGFFDNGQCFQKTGSVKVSNMDSRLKTDKVLNFSMEGSYTFKPECMSYFGMNDYWYGTGLQANFSLVERISFRVHDAADDKVVNQDLPFQAAKLLNAGIFTMGKRIPDQFGNFGREDNEIGMPVIQDFHNGKTMTYNLGGLPSDPAYRDLFIKTTRQVVADWNEALHRAFKGTELDRSGDYILLKVDGIDATPGHLGDLDRNYIWNFDKNMDSGLLGLSQSAPNPRTGYSVANNVLMYSGNLLSYIGSEKQKALILRDYEEMKKQVTEKMQKEFDAEQKGAAPQSMASGDDVGAQTIPESKETSTMKQELAQNLIRRLVDVAGRNVVPRTPRSILNPQSMQKIALQMQTAYQGKNKDIAPLKRKILTEDLKDERSYLRTIVEKALSMKDGRDEAMLSALSAAEILRSYGDKLPADERQALALQSRRMAMAADFQKNFRHMPGCILSVDGIPSLSGKSIADTPVEVLFSNWYASTLSHEMGHSLGLTHNFKGSYDKANFRFKDESDKEERPYSSVMDYSNSFDENYRKPGPYDVHALRVGYTGRIEVSDTVLANIKKQGKDALNGTVTIGMKDPDGGSAAIPVEISNGLVKLSQLKNAIIPSKVGSNGTRIKSWWSLDSKMLAKLPPKYYYFCTDVDTGGDPTCNRWDDGTSPVEIVRSYIRQYNEIYPVMNARGNKIKMSDLGRYLGRVEMSYLPIRGFLDETFFRAVLGGYSDVGDFAQAAFEGYKFFLNVYNTPEARGDVMDPSRFIRVDYTKAVPKVGADGKVVTDKDGEPVTDAVKTFAVVDGRSPNDLLAPGFDDGSNVVLRGIEFDKALAIQFLTLRGTGNPRYARYGLALSYAEFEKFMMQLPAQNSFLMRALRQTFSDNMTSMLFLDGGGVANIDPAYAPDTTDLMHYYAIISAAVMLEANTLEEKDNFAALFRVGSTLSATPPAGSLLVSKADTNVSDPTAMKFWSFSNAIFSADMIREAAQKRLVLENADALTAALTKMATSQGDALKTAITEMLTLLNKLNANGVLLNDAEIKAGTTMDKVALSMFNMLTQHIKIINSIAADLQEAKVPQDQVATVIGGQFAPLKKTFEVNAKASPLGLIVSMTIHKLTEGDVGMTAIADAIEVSPDTIKTNYGVILGNLETLNAISVQMNPNLNK